ncbi:AAA family ATPase [Streptomyces sp. NPDC020965]|uniref:AAA family ATPase n=1 Tax=Streptomyces sp. NPDC020965 TaxID=3365105 RepID=UPI0037897672
MHPDDSAPHSGSPDGPHIAEAGAEPPARANGTIADGTGRAGPDQSRWWIYRGTGQPLYDTSLRELLPAPPPWRRFTGAPVMPPPPWDDEEIERRLGRFPPPSAASEQIRREADMVNAALYLRRPLLVTGRPGTGKSSLAYRISRELRLGRVLRWHITSRTTLRSGLYEYDAIGRVQDSAALRTLRDSRLDAKTTSHHEEAAGEAARESALPGIGDYLQLGPLGTALLPHEAPRVLLIDELDKSDQDLANDLLGVFEEGQFPVPELLRVRRRHPKVTVLTDDPLGSADIVGGIVRCRAFPVVIITSNGEREFPPAFLRRCLTLRMPDPDHSQLVDMVAAHLTEDAVRGTRDGDLVGQFVQRSRERGGLAVDQLLNSVFLATSGRFPDGDGGEALQELVDALWHRLDGAGAETRAG